MLLTNVLSYAVLPALAVVIGGAVSSIRPLGPAVRSAIQHFAAGVVLAALATELLPEVMHKRMPLYTIAGFVLGVFAMLGLKAFIRNKPQEKSTDKLVALPVAMLSALGIDVALDGLLVGIAFYAGEKQGTLLTIALSLEVLFIGVSAAATLSSVGAARKKILFITTGLGLLLLLGAVIGTLVLSHVSGAILDVVLSFGITALLYLVMEELMVEAHEVPETPLLSATFFFGFLSIMLVAMLL